MSDSNFVDINNLGLQDEPLGDGFDPNANAFSGPPPLPKGNYVCSVAFRESDPEKQFQEKEYRTDRGHSAGRYFATKLIGTVISPTEYEGRKIFEDFVSTGIWRDDTSTIASILHLLGRGEEVSQIVAEGGGHLALARLFSQALSAEPRLTLRVDWEGRVKNEDTDQYDTIYKTMTEFRQRPDGTYDPVIKDGEGKQIGVARLKVKGFASAPNAATA